MIGAGPQDLREVQKCYNLCISDITQRDTLKDLYSGFGRYGE